MSSMRIFAIADLHLSFARPKPMHVFGEHWRDHPERIATAWRAVVGPDDIVLVAGDLSWAMKPVDAAVDLTWLAALPGRKVIIKGNHDYWFPSTRRKRDGLLGEGFHALYRNACVIGDVAFVGSKGAPLDPTEIGDDIEAWQRDLDKQLAHLQASIADLGFVGSRPATVVALLHYPPTAPGTDVSPFTTALERAGVSLCVYGHLHRQEDFEAALQGTVRGVTYRLTSADFLDFRPLDVTDLLLPGARARLTGQQPDRTTRGSADDTTERSR